MIPHIFHKKVGIMLLVDLETGLGKIKRNTRITFFGGDVHIFYGFEMTENWTFLNHDHLLMRTTLVDLSKAMQ
jgi:hypothetical protein